MDLSFPAARVYSLVRLVAEPLEPAQDDLEYLQLIVRMTVIVGVVLGVLLAIAFAVALLAFVFLSIFAGVTATSVIAAQVHHSTSKGITWFMVQLTLVAGALIGVSAGMWYSHHLHLPLWNLSLTGLGLLVGSGFGALVGWLLARVLQMLWKKARPAQ